MTGESLASVNGWRMPDWSTKDQGRALMKVHPASQQKTLRNNRQIFNVVKKGLVR